MKKILNELLTIYTRQELIKETGIPAYTITRALQGKDVYATQSVIDTIKLHSRRRGRIANKAAKKGFKEDK